ncbi:LOW QUALITY PROTEIN: protein PFC0760c [Daphnia magna]|uniref:LOW QUALITY PROTEIN: protein PFC0760c n=1 Tax=Daphnia magna TaxID=35525 RepID=UPI001E1BC560|nr:LOW QUALITY PROTEIN: protein PFC0760c [Daphnia magna]
MQWFVRTVFVLALTSSVLARKSNYWWMFPNFDENASKNRDSLVANVTQDDLRNGTDGQAANLTTIVEEADFNLPTDVDSNEDYLDKNEDIGSSVFPVEDLDRDNKTQTVTANENIYDQYSDEDIDWIVDKENQTDAKTFMLGDTLEADNETKIEQENPSSLEKLEMAELYTDLMNEEDEAVHVEGDAHPSSKLEEMERNDEQNAFSGDGELQEEKAEIDEPEQIFKEQDKAVHEEGDVHPSSKIELEEMLETEDVEDFDFPPDEKDEPVHENGDAHPSSEFEMDENNDNTEELEDPDFAEEISLSEGEVIPEEIKSSNGTDDDQDLNSNNNEEINSTSSEESQENHEENPIKENSELLENGTSDDLDLELSREDVLEKDEEKEAEIALKQMQDVERNAPIVGEGENIDDEDEIQPVKNNEPIDSDYEDATLHWVDEELLNMESSAVANKSSYDAIISEVDDTSAGVPIAPIFKTPLCSFNTRPYNLTVLPVNSISEMHGTDVSLLCKLVPYNASEMLPYFRLTWLFEKEGCQKDASDKHACTTVLTSKNYESSNSSNTLSYGLTKLNHTIHTGLYICDAEIYGCQSQNQNATQTSQALYLTVYTKPNYGFHIGIISSVCVLLLAILAGLVSYARRVQKQSKNRYQELLSSADIQYYPSKVLELPNSVYNTTTTGFVRMSASSFSSKSSFTSNEDA